MKNVDPKLYWHLRHNHFPPCRPEFIEIVGTVLDAVERGELSPQDVARVKVDGNEATVRDGDRPVTVAELVDNYRLHALVPERFQREQKIAGQMGLT